MMRTSTWMWMTAAIIGVAACSGGGTGPCDPGTCTGGDGASGGGGAGTGGDGGTTKSCGGASHGTCAADEFCHFDDATCGSDGMIGVCLPRPATCDPDPYPRCGCDGKHYDGLCQAHAGGSDVQGSAENCTATGTFICGSSMCTIATQYCEATYHMAQHSTTYACKPRPDACLGPIDCSCVGAVPCGDMCQPTGEGSVNVFCSVP